VRRQGSQPEEAETFRNRSGGERSSRTNIRRIPLHEDAAGVA
jgi:hypothetical protein